MLIPLLLPPPFFIHVFSSILPKNVSAIYPSLVQCCFVPDRCVPEQHVKVSDVPSLG
jgi:hypothetical protein